MCEERFWSKVDKNGSNGCWVWMAYKSKGYGRFPIGRSISVLAHRYSWVLANGEIPAGLVVRHKCRGKCVNPEHLELGTKAQNNADKIRDGTSTRGTKHPSVKLTEEQVRQIRAKKDEDCVKLAKEYNISQGHIYNILSGKYWKWVI